MIRFGSLGDAGEYFYTNNEVQLKIGNGHYERGVLKLSNNDIAWKGEARANSVMIPWSCVTVQAITQEPPRAIYFMIDVNLNFPNVFESAQPSSSAHNSLPPVNGAAANVNGNANGNGNHEDVEGEDGNDSGSDEGCASEDSTQEITEFWILPDAPELVDEIYQLMTKYPIMDDGRNDSDEEDMDDEQFFDGSAMDEMNLDDDNDRFADALE